MTDIDSARPQAVVDFRTRGFEHIVDFFRDGEVEERLNERIELFKTGGITERQKELILARVGQDYADVVVRQLPLLAIDSLRRRTLEEELSLESARITLDSSDPMFQKYLELAGNPEQLGAFVAWMDDLAVQGLGRMIHRPVVDNNRWSFLEHTKGLSFELAGCFELGDHSHIYGVNDGLDRLKDQLPVSGLSFEEPHVDVDHRYDVALIRDPQEDASIQLYSVSINRPIGDIKTMDDDPTTVAHVAMRSDKLVIEPLLPDKLRDFLFTERMKIAKEHAHENPDPNKMLHAAAKLRTMLGRYSLTDSAAVVPDATVVYMRSTREIDDEKLLASLEDKG